MSARSTSTLEPACSRSSTRAPISIMSATTRAGSSPASIARLTSSAATGSSTTTFSTIRRPTSAWTRVGRSGVAASMSNPEATPVSGRRSRAGPPAPRCATSSAVDLRVARPGAGERRPARRRRPARPRRPPRPSRRRSCAPSRRRRGARASRRVLSRKKTPCTRPVARIRRRTGDSAIRGYGNRMASTAARSTLAAELEAAGGVAAPATAAARLREVLAGALRHGRDELAKPRSGYDVAGRGRLRRPGRPAARRHARRRRAARRPRGRRRARVAAGRRRPSRRSSTSPARARPSRPPTWRCARGRARAACCSPTRPQVEPAELAEFAPVVFEEHVGRHRPPARRRPRAPARRARRRPSCASRSAPGTRCGSPRPRRGWARELDGRAARGGAAGAPRRRRRRRRAPARGPRSGAPRRPPDPPAARRDGQVGRLPHGLRPPRARLRGQRARARAGRRRGAARRGPAGREAVGRPAPRVPQPAPRARHPRVHRDAARPQRSCDCRNGERMRAMSLPGQIATTVKTKSQTLATLAKAGHRPPVPAGPAAAHRRRARPLGPDARRRLHRLRRALPRRGRDRRRGRHAHLPGGPRAHERARPRAARTPASAPATASRSCAATTAASSRRSWRARSSAPTPCSSTRRSPSRS